MDPKLLTWFFTPLGSLATASRTINFQQAEISRLVAHLRQQISKQNKALKKAAQQIRENSKTVAELEASRVEVIRLKRELASLSNGLGEQTGGAANVAFESPVLIRPIPRQHSSSEAGRHFLITGKLPENPNADREKGNPGPTNDGFGANVLNHSGRSSMTTALGGAVPPGQPGVVPQDAFCHQSAGPVFHGRLMAKDGSAVVMSDRTKGVGNFKPPDILCLSPRRLSRTEDEQQ